MFNILWRQKVKNEVNTYTLTVLLVGIFIGMGTIFFIGAETFIRIDTVFNIAFVCGAVVLLVHLPFLKRLNRYPAEIMIYSFLGWGPILTGLFLTINFFFHSPAMVSDYDVASAVAHPEERELPFPVSVTIKDPYLPTGVPDHAMPAAAYNDFSYLLKFKGEDEIKYKEKPRMAEMTTAKGFFGYHILLKKELY